MIVLCLFLPAALFCVVRYQLNKKELERYDTRRIILNVFAQYVAGNVIINLVINSLLYFFLNATGSLEEKILDYGDFSLKYLVLAVLLACLIPLGERYVRNHIQFTINGRISIPFTSLKINTLSLYLALFIMGVHHFVRIFDNCFWGDEGIVVRAARSNWPDMLTYVAQNGHSPFHYAVAWMSVRLMGDSGWVYHLSASLPYFLLLLITATVVKKWFGKTTAFIFGTLATFLECSIKYNLEIRMYAWTQLFIFVAYLTLYGIYKTGKLKFYFALTLSSIGAVYSHYFALPAIGIFYMVLLFFTVFQKCKELVRVLVSGGVTLLALAPWLVFAQSVKGSVITDYGNFDPASIRECLQFIFASKYSTLIFAVFIVTTILAFLYRINAVKIEKREDEKLSICVNLANRNFSIPSDWIWLLSGIAAPLGTIVAARIFSELFYPILLLRYVYTSYVCVWVVFAVVISKLYYHRVWALCLAGLILFTCYPQYINTVRAEQRNNIALQATLMETSGKIDTDDCIYTDMIHVAWTVSNVYYPNVPCVYFSDFGDTATSISNEINSSRENWLFLGEPISEALSKILDFNSLHAVLVVENGYVGTWNTWIYQVVPN